MLLLSLILMSHPGAEPPAFPENTPPFTPLIQSDPFGQSSFDGERPYVPQSRNRAWFHGLRHSRWFGAKSLPFQWDATLGEVWAKPNLDLAGRPLHLVRWDPPALGRTPLPPEQQALADRLAERYSGLVREAFASSTPPEPALVREGLILAGRVMRLNPGVRDPQHHVLDRPAWGILFFKLMDAHTGEILVAVHHRVQSPPSFPALEAACEAAAPALVSFLAQQAKR